MMWLALIAVTALQTCVCTITFTKSVHDRWWYFPLGMLLGVSTNCIWLLSAKLLDTKEKIYTLSLFWDCAMVAVYFLVPVLFFGIRLDRIGVIGLVIAIVGALLVKSRLG